jgi:hypothetical protein
VRKLPVLPLLLVLGLGLLAVSGPWAGAQSLLAAGAQSLLAAGSCQPMITGWSTFKAGPHPDFTLQGSCFGTGGALHATDGEDLRVSIFPLGTSTGQARAVMAFQHPSGVPYWNACSNRTDPIEGSPDTVGCTVTVWTTTSVTLQSFDLDYGGTFVDNNGDLLAVQVWNAGTLTGPAIVYIRTGAPGSAAANSEVSSIGASLASPSKAFRPLSSDVVDAIIALVLALFLTFPANVFNTTFEENYTDIVAWWEKWTGKVLPVDMRKAAGADYKRAKAFVLGRLDLAGRAKRKWLQREQVSFVFVLVVGSLFASLLDPGFGLNFRTVLSYVAIVVAILAGVVVSGLITSGYHRARGRRKIPYKLEALPFGLVIAAVCVVISRGSGFVPGYLYGVICGITFSRELARHEEGHVIALDSLARIAVCLLAWMAWAGVTHYAARPGSFFAIVLLDDFAASLFVLVLVSTVISLFPLKGFPGYKLKAWHKGAWAATFGIALFILVQVLLRPNSTDLGPSHTPLVTTIVLFALFAGGSWRFRQHFVDKRRREADAAATIALITPSHPDDHVASSPRAAGGSGPDGQVPVSPTANPAPEHP